MPNYSTELAAMIGAGVGIDYSLFVVTRFRQTYDGDAGATTMVAMGTAGRAVLFASRRGHTLRGASFGFPSRFPARVRSGRAFRQKSRFLP